MGQVGLYIRLDVKPEREEELAALFRGTKPQITPDLMARARDMLSAAPAIERVDVRRSGNGEAAGGEERIPMQVGSELRITSDGSIVIGNPELELAWNTAAASAVLTYRYDAGSGEHVIRLLEPMADRKHMAAHRQDD
jgi:quinol monooxygenase YgiN